jgi:uncharacterized protein (DUF1778 family)
MEKKFKHSVSGLANIAALLNKAEFEARPEGKPTQTQASIVDKTRLAITYTNAVTAPDLQKLHEQNRRAIEAGIREAYNLGHADATALNAVVLELTERQYEDRTRFGMPAVMAAVMEQTGENIMLLELGAAATVFQRNRIDFTVDERAGSMVAEFVLHALDDTDDLAALKVDGEITYSQNDAAMMIDALDNPRPPNDTLLRAATNFHNREKEADL